MGNVLDAPRRRRASTATVYPTRRQPILVSVGLRFGRRRRCSRTSCWRRRRRHATMADWPGCGRAPGRDRTTGRCGRRIDGGCRNHHRPANSPCAPEFAASETAASAGEILENLSSSFEELMVAFVEPRRERGAACRTRARCRPAVRTRRSASSAGSRAGSSSVEADPYARAADVAHHLRLGSDAY